MARCETPPLKLSDVTYSLSPPPPPLPRSQMMLSNQFFEDDLPSFLPASLSLFSSESRYHVSSESSCLIRTFADTHLSSISSTSTKENLQPRSLHGDKCRKDVDSLLENIPPPPLYLCMPFSFSETEIKKTVSSQITPLVPRLQEKDFIPNHCMAAPSA